MSNPHFKQPPDRRSLTKTLFDFNWKPQDELMALKPPRRYGRVEIQLPDRIADGVIERILEVSGANTDLPTYKLRISTDANLRALSVDQINNIGVRVCS